MRTYLYNMLIGKDHCLSLSGRTILFGTLLILLISAVTARPLVREERGLVESARSGIQKAKDYLRSFGWLPSWNPETWKESSARMVKKATRLFQKFWGLPETGEVDHATEQLMNTPRCAVPDNFVSVDDGSLDEEIELETDKVPDVKVMDAESRRRRYVIQKAVLYGNKWKRRDLKYRVNKYSQKISSSVVDGVLRKSFHEWEKASPFTFILKEQGPVHIDIQFEYSDGPGKALAYAYGPGPAEGGDMRFDEFEDWSVRSPQGQNLYMVALHEMGHVLGLDHSNTPGAIMNPYYTGYVKGKGLQPDDIAGVQAIYGPPSTQPAPPKPTPQALDPSAAARRTKLSPVLGDICRTPEGQKNINGITITGDKRMYAFKGQYFFELKPETDRSQLVPELITGGWPGLPSTIDTVFTGPEGNTFFFKGDQYWKFKNRQLQPGFPKAISNGFPGVPSDLDAVFVYNKNNRIYFIKGDKYWRFEPGATRRVADGYPKSLSEWKKIPSQIDAVTTWRDGRTYFFSGKDYYKFNDFHFAVEDGYPKSVASWWFACEEQSDFESPVSSGSEAAI